MNKRIRKKQAKQQIKRIEATMREPWFIGRALDYVDGIDLLSGFTTHIDGRDAREFTIEDCVAALYDPSGALLSKVYAYTGRLTPADLIVPTDPEAA